MKKKQHRKENHMFEIENLYNNQNVSFTQKKKGFRVLEHEEDMSVSPYSAQTAFFL